MAHGVSRPSVQVRHHGRMALHVRSMAHDDLKWALGLNQANLPALGDETAASFAHLLDVSAFALVATVDGVRAGFSISMTAGADYASVNYRWFCDRHAEFIYLDRVAVDAGMRTVGVGRALYAETDRLGSAATAPGLPFCLEVNLEPRNDESLAFHDRMGFVEVGQQRTPSGKLVSMMERPLVSSPR
jgi:predicted GNAT superfamily acetyltransferase